MENHPAGTPRWPYALVRVTTAGLALLAVAQAALAGSFLNGHYDVLMVHAVTGMVMVAVAVVQAVAVLVLRRAGIGWQVTLFGLVLPVLLAGQVALGLARILALHVPLGALFVAGILRLVAWAWRPRARADRNLPDRTRADQTLPDQTLPDQTQADRTRADRPVRQDQPAGTLS